MFKNRWEKITEFHQKKNHIKTKQNNKNNNKNKTRCSIKILTKKRMYLWMSAAKLKTTSWTWRDAQWLRIFAALTEDPNSIPRTYVMRFITAYNSSSRGSGAPLWPLQTGYLCAHTHIQIHTHNHK